MSEKPFAITLDKGTSLLNHTGTWRTERPIYIDRLPPCNQACPAGENIQQWLYLAEEGRYEEAWQQIMEDNPFPGIMGRICYHPCESSCNRGEVDSAVGINGIERFLGDLAVTNRWSVSVAEPTGHRVMVVGAGCAGLSAAYHLKRMGHEVTVFEKSPKAGGMMRYAIPKYRLPREKLNAEIERLLDMGVKIECGVEIDDYQQAKQEGGFDAVFLSIGAQIANELPMNEANSPEVLDPLDVLRRVEEDQPTGLRGHVVVYGGGNTAVDIARYALKLSARATVIYHRTEQYMAAHAGEIKEARAEGVKFSFLRRLSSIDGLNVQFERMKQGQGRDIHPTGQFEVFEADIIVGALGQSLDESGLTGLEKLKQEDHLVWVGEDMQTNLEGVFAGGDMTPSLRTATSAIGQGKKAARNIDAFLKGARYVKAEKHEIAEASMLNTWYYTDAPRIMRPVLEMLRRQSGFSEVVGNLTEEQAKFEARRCMSCGNCFECDNCYGMCPDNAITNLGTGKGFEFKYDYCKGCGLCVNECPCGAIKMVPEDI